MSHNSVVNSLYGETFVHERDEELRNHHRLLELTLLFTLSIVIDTAAGMFGRTVDDKPFRCMLSSV